MKGFLSMATSSGGIISQFELELPRE